MEPRKSQSANFFAAAVIVIGALTIGLGLSQWRSADLARLVTYVLITVVAARMRIQLPSIQGTLSVSFLFAFVGVLELSLAESILLGIVSVLSQSVFPKKSKNYQIAFSVSNNCFAIAIVYALYAVLGSRFSTLGMPLILTVLTLSFFLLNTVPIAIAIGLTEGRNIVAIWKKNYLWSFPLYLVGACLAGLMHFASLELGWQVSLLLLPLVYLIYSSYSSYTGRLQDGKAHAEEMASLHLRTIEALALAIEAKDDSTHAHLQRIQIYVVELAKQLGLAPKEIEALRAAAILHDIGKLAVPEHISSKAGRLTPEEFEKMKIHPIVGAEILERVQFPYPVAPIVLAHHEKWDGSGYPYGLKGEQIPIGARILSVVDSLDVLSSDKQYRPALPLEDAVAYISRESGKSFDPKIVDLLKLRYLELEELSKQNIPKQNDIQRVAREQSVDRRVNFEEEPPNLLLRAQEAPRIDFLTSIAAARQEAQNLYELSQELGTSLSLSETLSLVASRLKPMVPFHALALFTLQNEVLTPEYVEGVDSMLLQGLNIPKGAGISGWVAANSKPVINGNPVMEPGLLSAANLSTVLRGALAVPLVGVNGTIGVITLYRTEADSFSRDHLRILQAVAGKLAFTVENARKYEQAETSASIDYLTGLPNARAIFQRVDAELARSSRSGEPLAVMVCDLDGFKKINDMLGHLTGNKILRAFAASLRELFRQYDLVGRLGGDEFVVALPGMNLDDAQQRVHQIDEMVKQVGMQITGTEHLAISIGIAIFPQDGETVEALLSEADRRMYQVKRLNQASRTPIIIKA